MIVNAVVQRIVNVIIKKAVFIDCIFIYTFKSIIFTEIKKLNTHFKINT